jgi:hypothetical protein
MQKNITLGLNSNTNRSYDLRIDTPWFYGPLTVIFTSELFHQSLESITLGLGLDEFLLELAHVDGYQVPAFADELIMILYPTNALICFHAAVLAFKLALCLINNIGIHTDLQ